MLKKITFITLFMVVLAPFLAFAHTLNIKTNSYISLDKLIEELKGNKLIFIGELHDNLEHHQAQLSVIKELAEQKSNIVIGLEMFRKDSQKALDDWVSGDSNPHDFIKVYNDNWSYWDKYKEIFLYARNNGIPMIGLNVPREITRKVAREGFDSLSHNELKSLPNVSCVVDQQYEEFIRKAMGTSSKHIKSFKNFCEAQLLWDEVMAENLISHLNNNSEDTIIVLAGSGHSWKYGIPRQIKEKTNYDFRVLLPEIPGRLEREHITLEEADYLLMSPESGPLH